jgi:MFS family permease
MSEQPDLWAPLPGIAPAREPRKILVLSSLYFAQGLPFGFFTTALPALMRQQGYDLAQIGLSSLLALPWALKFLWAPLVDRVGSGWAGRRKSVIIPIQLLSAGILLAAGLVGSPESMTLLMGVILLVNLLAATQDIATDGLAVSLLSEPERGLGNAIQVGGYRVGMIVGGGVLLMIMGVLGWFGVFVAMSVLSAVAVLPLFGFKEPEPEPSGPLFSLDWFYRPGIGQWLVFLLLYKFGDALASSMVKPFLVDSGFSISELGLVSGTLGSIMGLSGAFAGGWAASRFGRVQALVICGVLQSFSVLGYALAVWAIRAEVGHWVGILAVAAEHLAGGMATVALFTAMMDRCRPGKEGMDYTLQASIVVLSTGIGSALGGAFAEAFGYLVHFLMCFGVSLVGVGAVRWLALLKPTR